MRDKWQPCVDVMPFFDFCAGFMPPKQPFAGTGSYVFHSGKDIALCILYTPEIAAYATECEKSVLSYCARHDHTAYVYRESLYPGVHPTWQKARVVLNHLASHKGVVWVDADSLILRQEKTVFADLFAGPKKLHVSRDFAQGSAAFNGGVIAFKSDPWTFEVLKDWDRFACENKPSKLWDHGSDQKVLSDLILSRDPKAQFHQAHEMAEFNCDPRFMDENTFLLHFMNYPQGYKIPWMQYWNACCLDFDETRWAGQTSTLRGRN